MVASVWRMRRLWGHSVANRPETDELDRIAGAFSDLAKQPELHLLQRYQRSLYNLCLFAEYQTNLDSANPNPDNPIEP